MQKLRDGIDIKNYADYLYQNAGAYIMAWIIEGAQKVINSGFGRQNTRKERYVLGLRLKQPFEDV